jgi:hypothetical protein
MRGLNRSNTIKRIPRRYSQEGPVFNMLTMEIKYLAFEGPNSLPRSIYTLPPTRVVLRTLIGLVTHGWIDWVKEKWLREVAARIG